MRKKFQRKATNLLEKLLQHKELIQWDQNGIVTFNQNEAVPGASIFSLVRATFYPSVKDSNLAGLENYVKLLKTLGLTSFIKNKALLKAKVQQPPQQALKPLGESETVEAPNPDKHWFYIGNA